MTETINLEKFQRYYNALNPEQRAAVDAIEGPVMTIAGAGTGKTQILAVRIAKILLDTQIDPFNVLCLTFTDAGVSAMRKRLIEIIGPTAYHIKVCTFHSFCNEVIKDNPEKFLFKRDFEQVDDLEKIEILQEIIDELGVRSVIRPHGDPYYYQYDLENRIKDLKKENFPPAKFAEKMIEVETFLQKFLPLIKDFVTISGSPKEEQISLMHPDNILNKLPPAGSLQQTYLNYYQKLWNDYEQALTGQKRTDGTKRTAFKNALKAFFLNAEKDLPKQQEFAKAYALYQEKLLTRARYDYEDMILFVSQSFAKDQDLLRQYQETYQYILVDEYQDTNSAQNQTIDLLGSYFQSPNIFVVGDDDQSIYRFQGASIENIIDFHRRYSQSTELKLITLIKNYRSQQSILDASGAVIKHNQSRIASYLPNIDKNLQSQTATPPTQLELAVYETENIENYGIAKAIQKLISTGTPASEIAVLYRNHYHVEDLIELMLKLGVPFELKAGHDILKDLEIGKLIRLFQAIEKPNENDLLSQALFIDFLKINRSDILKLSHYFYVNRLEKSGYNLFQILSLPEHLNAARLENPEQFQRLALKISDWKDYSQNETLSQFFENVIKESGHLEFALQSKTKLSSLNKLNTLFRAIKDLTRKNHQITISQFLAQLQQRRENKLKLNEEPLQTNQESVQLMTAHGSKGLEFQHVFILKCTHNAWGKNSDRDKIKLPKGLLKSEIADDKLEAEEDERRLFYVALTRAKKQIHLSYAKFRSEQNKQKEDIPSLFLSEIPAELISTIQTVDIEKEALAHLETTFLDVPQDNLTTNEAAFIRKLAEDHILSPTSLNNYLICPRRFFLQNLIRLPQGRNKSSAMGSAIHAALDFYFHQYRRTKIKPPRELLTLKYKSCLEKELLTDKDYKERLEIGQNILNDYFDHFNESFDANTFTEYNFSSHGVTLDGIRLTGKIDKITANPDNLAELTVSDFKTGNTDTGLTKVKPGGDYWRQVIFYKILCDNSPQFRKQFQGASMTYGLLEFLEKSRKTKQYLNSNIPLTSEAIEEVSENIRVVHQQILDLQFEKIEQCDTCNHCPFYNICWK